MAVHVAEGAAAGDATFRQSRKSLMPLKLRNISQLSGVSSVMFHSALQENSMTWSHWGQGGAQRGLLAPSEGSPDQSGHPRDPRPLLGCGRAERPHGGLTYCLVQQLLLNQLQHGLWAEKRTCRGQASRAPVSPMSPPRATVILFLANIS